MGAAERLDRMGAALGREYVLTLSCPDKPGIVYAVSSFLVQHSANILASQQYGESPDGRFFMRVHFGVPPAGQPDQADPAARLAALERGFSWVAEAFHMSWQLHDAAARTRTLIMVSRLGHCLNDLLFRWKTGALPVDIVGVVSNHPDFGELAGSYRVPFHHIPVTPQTKAAAEAELLRVIDEAGADLVVLARYMQVLSAEVCKRAEGRMINIHHSFLPSFKGASPYHQAHARGVKLVGATAHYVTPDLDEGPIIEQDVIRVDHTLSPEGLARAGRDVEARVLATAVTWHAEHRVLLNRDKTIVFGLRANRRSASMAISVFDLFKVGIGPSSSHTVGPMVAARMFAEGLRADGMLPRVHAVRVSLYGSLALTGRGHGSDKAILLGLEGERPATVDVDAIPARLADISQNGTVRLLGEHEIGFTVAEHLEFHRKKKLSYHPNGMRFTACDAAGAVLRERTYYSVGGGFVANKGGAAAQAGTAPQAGPGPQGNAGRRPLPYPFSTAAELLGHAARTGLPVSGIMLENERALGRTAEQVVADLAELWRVMRECVRRGCRTDGLLPGGLKVPRRAPGVLRQLTGERDGADPLRAMDWVTLYALAVNEENAAGGRVVTAPTNGAAGIIPAVLHYYDRFVPGASAEGVTRFLLTAAAIGILFKENASISGAEVGCQGEVGSACSMAAGALAEVLGGTPEQVENAAEIGIEHNLGLTCDPVGGLVQVPCIERNAIASITAINAARMALRGDGQHFVSLDKAIATMRATGRDMLDKYKETSRGGLAVNVIEC